MLGLIFMVLPDIIYILSDEQLIPMFLNDLNFYLYIVELSFFYYQYISMIKMKKYFTLLLFIGLVWGQEDLLIKKAESSIKFKNGQKLIIRYTNAESNVVFNTEGEFKSVDNDFLMISTENVIAKKNIYTINNKDYCSIKNYQYKFYKRLLLWGWNWFDINWYNGL